ncbi:MAG: ABC transporter permease [Patescibacteria group bacterium]|nr:ABC transporter permease [Patescibacteria group bacterium]
MITNLNRIVKTGFVNFWRNGFLSLAAIIVLTLCLLSFGAIMFADVFGRTMLKQVEDKVNITVYFTPTAQDSDVTSFVNTINKLPEVASTTFISSDQALVNFQTKWQNNSLILNSLNEIGNNPFPAALIIKTKLPSEYAGLVNFIQSPAAESASGTSVIESVNYGENQVLIDRLGRLIPDVEGAGAIVAILLVLVAVIMTFNTIRLIIYSSRDEISVMRLVGASHAYVRGPFVISGIMYGLVSGILTIFIMAAIVFWSGAIIAHFAGLQVANDLASVTSVVSVYFISNIGEISGIILLAGCLLGALSSYLAVKRYLRV